MDMMGASMLIHQDRTKSAFLSQLVTSLEAKQFSLQLITPQFAMLNLITMLLVGMQGAPTYQN